MGHDLCHASFFCANISYLKYKNFFLSKKKGSKKNEKESSDHIDLTLNDDDIDEIEKEMEKDIEVMPEISGENETEIWDFGDLI